MLNLKSRNKLIGMKFSSEYGELTIYLNDKDSDIKIDFTFEDDMGKLYEWNVDTDKLSNISPVFMLDSNIAIDMIKNKPSISKIDDNISLCYELVIFGKIYNINFTIPQKVYEEGQKVNYIELENQLRHVRRELKHTKDVVSYLVNTVIYDQLNMENLKRFVDMGLEFSINTNTKIIDNLIKLCNEPNIEDIINKAINSGFDINSLNRSGLSLIYLVA